MNSSTTMIKKRALPKAKPGRGVIVCRTEEWAVKIAGKLDYYVLIRCEHREAYSKCERNSTGSRRAPIILGKIIELGSTGQCRRLCAVWSVLSACYLSIWVRVYPPGLSFGDMLVIKTSTRT